MSIIKKLIRLSLPLSLLLASQIALAANVVIVNPANSNAIDADTISKIYLGKTKSFASGDKVNPINQVEGSGIRDSFNADVVGKSSSQMKSYWSKLIFTGKGTPPAEERNDAAVKAAVAADINAIGYIDESNADDSVKIIHSF